MKRKLCAILGDRSAACMYRYKTALVCTAGGVAPVEGMSATRRADDHELYVPRVNNRYTLSCDSGCVKQWI